MKPIILLSVAGLLLLSGCASQQDIVTLDSRLAYVELELGQLKSNAKQRESNLTQKNKNLRSQSASLRVQLDDIRNDIQRLNGKLEAVEFQIKKDLKNSAAVNQQSLATAEALRAQMQKNEQRIQNLEGYLSLDKKPAGSVKQPPARPGAALDLQSMSETQIYDAAKDAFDKGEFELARERFGQLIQRFPSSKNADNAQFWIGEIYYREKWYEKAILEYQKVIEKYPNGNKVKDALLKQGYSFFNMDDKPSARLILKELIKKYPDSNQAKIAKQKLDQMR